MAQTEYDLIILGAGLAGAFAAWELQKHFQVLVIDGPSVLGRGSGVSGGLINPMMAQKGRGVWEAETALNAFRRIADEAHVPSHIVRMDGLFRPAQKPEQANWFMSSVETSPHLGLWYDKMVLKAQFRMLNAPHGGIWVHSGGTVKINHLAKWLVSEAKVDQQCVHITAIDEEPTGVRIETQDGNAFFAKKCLTCLGNGLLNFTPFKYLDLHPVKGQVEKTEPSHLPSDIPSLSGGMYVAAFEDQWVAGSSFRHHYEDLNPSHSDRSQILSGVRSMVPAFPTEIQSVSEVGIRITIPRTRLPMVGPVTEKGNLWVLTGLGSKGLLMAPYLAENLAYWLQNPHLIPAQLTVRHRRQ
ncbi:MAG: FAD-binding oxidoreductase [Bacteroidetes Order II. Incertae sedis bacterium]|nr:FAD-binding oxidoreductase [Bacteroidetes Order II. bacterium]